MAFVEDLRKIAKYLEMCGVFDNSVFFHHKETFNNGNGQKLELYIDIYPTISDSPVNEYDRPFVGFCYQFHLYRVDPFDDDYDPFDDEFNEFYISSLFKFRIVDKYIKRYLALYKPVSHEEITSDEVLVNEVENNDAGISQIEDQIIEIVNSDKYNNLIKNSISKLMIQAI